MREAIESGALHMIALFIKLENETNFMMVEPEKSKLVLRAGRWSCV